MSDLHSRIEAALAEDDEYPMSWFLVYEGYDGQNDRVLHYAANEGAVYWNVQGMLYTSLENLDLVLNGPADEGIDE